ncbi:MAG: hypothetical protein RLZZ480_291 [Candidatus Parcubacteria bacterium]|jgi:hypothetical protein
MKYITSSSLCAVLIFSFFVSSVPRTHAELSEEAKTQIKEILATEKPSGGIMDIINYLYSVMFTESMIGYIQPTTTPDATNTSTPKADNPKNIERINACAQAMRLSKDLSKGSSDIQVQYLQQLLNIEAFDKNLPNHSVMKEGPGSYGNETMYFGNATAIALEKWQSRNSSLSSEMKPGVLDAATRNAMVILYCIKSENNSLPAPVQPPFPVVEIESKKPSLTVSTSTLTEGESAQLTFIENGFKKCYLITKTTKLKGELKLKNIDNPYTVTPANTSEYRLGCVNGLKPVYSEWVKVTVNKS